MCNTILWGFCGWLRMLAFQWVVYFLLRVVSRVADLEKQLPRQLSLGQSRADTAVLWAIEAPWGISSGWVEALELNGFYVFTSSTLHQNTWA